MISAPRKKVIVVGLDGLEPTIVGPLLDHGELPNLASLRERGGFSRVATTSPAQTPVAWSSFATGTNPGGHGIFDFLRRNPQTYLPDLALNRYEQKNAFLPPKAVNLRRGVPVWEPLGAAGISSTIVRCPCTYPPDPVRGRMLSGMGVPDLRGGLGTSTFYTTAAEASARESENVVRVRIEPDGSVATHLIGPRNPKTRSDLGLDLTLRIDRQNRRVMLRAASGEALELAQGRWSDWLRVKFKMGLLQAVGGIVRFYLVRLEPELELYASPVNFDPENPLFPISAPDLYADELSERIGLFHTTGMVEDHAGLNNERFGEDAFLDQCDNAWREREAMMVSELGRFEEGLFYVLFDTPDRVQHMFWRYREPDHPANRGEPPAGDYAAVIEDQYRRADAAVGRALEFADDRTLVIALSDHGFNSFRRGFHVNTWLLDNGFLALRPGVRAGEEAGDLLRHVDWSRTKAYALGLGGIYLNIEGREGQGIVPAAEAGAVSQAIARGLQGLHDPETGALAVRDALPRTELYAGPYADEAPDLVLHLGGGYRISWEAAMGGIPSGHFADNTKKWSGDHIIDPALVPGVLFMNRPFRGEGARLVDLAPTILDNFGLAKGAAMEGSSLLQ